LDVILSEAVVTKGVPTSVELKAIQLNGVTTAFPGDLVVKQVPPAGMHHLLLWSNERGDF
jgi:hypothetical protein